MNIRKVLLRAGLCLLAAVPFSLTAETLSFSSPDGCLRLEVSDQAGRAAYSVFYNDAPVVLPSPLGFVSAADTFGLAVSIKEHTESARCEDYALNRCKTSSAHYEARRVTVSFADRNPALGFAVEFSLGNHDLGLRYLIPSYQDTRCRVVDSELTGLVVPGGTTTFLCPQSKPMAGWMRSKPSYEEEYTPDEPAGTPSRYGEGYTFPCLFHLGNRWLLVSETGVSGAWCGSHLSDGKVQADGSVAYSIAYPMPGENNGFGSTGAQTALPAASPWRTLTLGESLAPIAETTLPFDLVEPRYEPSCEYRFGKSTWSWMVWDDAGVNYRDLRAFIKLAGDLGYEYSLVDGLWDRMGSDLDSAHKKVEELARYADSLGVKLFLWYNSNGAWNDAPQGPRQRMADPVARKQEMKWMQSVGIKGIKVDFFAGDKQETMRLYEQILSDADDYGLMCIFHGCTLPRGWERMYPNYVGSEAVLASENLKFSQHFDDQEAFNACLHPFIRNAVGAMEFGGSALNRYYRRDNAHGNRRVTGDAFELATAVLFQNPIQNFALTPNNLYDAPAEAVQFMKDVPTVWDETRLVDGYPGRFVALARRHGNRWYLAAVNATGKPLELTLDVSFMLGENPQKDAVLTSYCDGNNLTFAVKTLRPSRQGRAKLVLPPDGGAVLVGN